MSMIRQFHRGASLAAVLLAAAAAHGATIATSQITPSTALGQYLYFSIDQIADGITSDASPFNGYASGFGVTSGRITLTLDQSYDLDSFVLWNDINVSNEGVRTFKLEFVDAGGFSLGSTSTLAAVSALAPQTYNFASTIGGVKTVYLDVLTSSLQIEIREVEFNGVSSVPEPATFATLLAGLGGLVLLTRARRA